MDALRDVASGFGAVLRASDTFKILTSDGAARLSRRAEERAVLIKEMEDLARVHISSLAAQKDALAALHLARGEAALQRSVARWLRRIGGES